MLWRTTSESASGGASGDGDTVEEAGGAAAAVRKEGSREERKGAESGAKREGGALSACAWEGAKGCIEPEIGRDIPEAEAERGAEGAEWGAEVKGESGKASSACACADPLTDSAAAPAMATATSCGIDRMGGASRER